MQINSLKPADGSKKARRRLGRGIGSGLGKTAGRGHKGQHSRAGGYHKVGFEGGQMPLQRRLPKRGFVSMKRSEEVRLGDLARVDGDQVNLEALKLAGVITIHAEQAKVILAGKLERALKVTGLRVSKGARAAIEAAGGSIVLPEAKPEGKRAKATAERRAKAAERMKAVRAQPAKPEAKPKAEAKPAKGDEKAAKAEKPAKEKAPKGEAKQQKPKG